MNRHGLSVKVKQPRGCDKEPGSRACNKTRDRNGMYCRSCTAWQAGTTAETKSSPSKTAGYAAPSGGNGGLSHNHFFPTHVNGSLKAHPNQLRASARKKRNRFLRDQADQAEAARLGITVDQLHAKRVKETQELLLKQKADEKEALRRAREETTRPRSWSRSSW